METDGEKRHFLWQHYFQLASQNIRNLKLSPTYKSVNSTVDQVKTLLDQFNDFGPRNGNIIGADIQNAKWIYDQSDHDKEIQSRTEEIRLKYFPTLLDKKQECYALKNYVYDSISVYQIGIEQLYTKEGLVFIKTMQNPHIQSYRYSVSNLVNHRKRSLLNFSYLGSFRESVSTTIYTMKTKLNNELDYTLNGYLLETELELPLEETILPVAKGKLSQHIGL